MAKPSSYETKKTASINEALKFVSFPVDRAKVSFDYRGKTHEFNREVIFRTDTMQGFETLSPGYQITKHEDALQACFEGLTRTGIPFRLQEVGLDKGGAKMLARFQFEKEYKIIKGIDSKSGWDTILPELTCINSYDGSFGLGFDLGSFRGVCLNLAQAKVVDLRARWMHLGTTASPEKLVAAATDALKAFENVIVPQYRVMAETEISKDLATKAVVRALQMEVLPKKIGHFAVHCVNSDRALEKEKALKRSTWTLFNAFSWCITHRFVGSPTRVRELQSNFTNAFKDGGKKLLLEAKKIDDKEVNEWLEKATEAEVA